MHISMVTSNSCILKCKAVMAQTVMQHNAVDCCDAVRSCWHPHCQFINWMCSLPLTKYVGFCRGLVSLQARQGGSGGSRGNPASGPSSGPASARKATPAPARHLAFHQASPHKQCSISDRTTMISPRTNSEAPPSPILSLPSPRPSRAAIHSPGPAALRSPSLSLPSPSAPDQNPGSAVENFFSPTAAKAEWLAADKALPEEEEQHKEVEVYVLSEIWKVFEQILKQVRCVLKQCWFWM